MNASHQQPALRGAGVQASRCTTARESGCSWTHSNARWPPLAGLRRVQQQQQGERTSRRRARGTGRQVVMNSLAPSQSARFSTLGIVALMPTICRRHRELFSRPDRGSPVLLCSDVMIMASTFW
jgi:hypothetical protein